MSISTEITRLQTLRNNIRTKLINLGVFSNSSATLSDCYTAINGITKQTSATVSGATVSVDGGYHSGSISGTVASGTQGTPTATKGTVSGNAVSVTPSCTDTTGYITGTTKTGTAVTISASELVSGNKSITSTASTDVTNYATAQISDANLVAGNIKSGVIVLGIEGTHEGGITPSGNKAITATTSTQTGIDVTSYATVSVQPTPTETKTATANGTVSPSSGKYLSSVTVAIPSYTDLS